MDGADGFEKPAKRGGAVVAGVEEDVVVAALPKLNPVCASCDGCVIESGFACENRPGVAVGALEVGVESAASAGLLLGKEKRDFADDAGWLDVAVEPPRPPNKLLVPVLAPNPEMLGGGPAGVVDGPNSDVEGCAGGVAPACELPASADLAGVPKPPNPLKSDFGASSLPGLDTVVPCVAEPKRILELSPPGGLPNSDVEGCCAPNRDGVFVVVDAGF